MLRYLVPAILPFGLFVVKFLYGKRKSEEALILWNVLAFSALYLMFVRIEVLLVVFLIITFGVAWRFFGEFGKILRIVSMCGWTAFLGCLLFFEIALAVPPSRNISKFVPEDRERMAALKGLVEAIDKCTESDSIILADFNISPVILAYANRGIVLHPKFESVRMRDRVQKYYEALFGKEEEKLNHFCNENNAGYYVFTNYVWQPEKGKSGWIYSPKYVANAQEPDYKPYAFRYLYEDDSRVAYFIPMPAYTVSVYSPKYDMEIVRYKIFKSVSETDKKKARDHLARGEEYIAKENYAMAQQELLEGINLFPGLPAGAYTKLGVAYKYLGNDSEAVKYMTMGASFSKEGRQ